MIQKRSYDRSSKQLKPLLQGQVVCLQTAVGHTRLGSYLVNVDGVLYWCSRQHLLPVNEPQPAPPGPHAPPLVIKTPAAVVRPRPPDPGMHSLLCSNPSSPSAPRPACLPSLSTTRSPAAFSISGSPPLTPTNSSGTEEEGFVHMCSGWVSRPPDRYGEYV